MDKIYIYIYIKSRYSMYIYIYIYIYWPPPKNYMRKMEILINMGNGASMQAQCALDMESAKPLDCSDVTDLNYAKMELMNARRQAQFYRNQALPKYQVDTTGDGVPNAIGYDTNRNGKHGQYRPPYQICLLIDSYKIQSKKRDAQR